MTEHPIVVMNHVSLDGVMHGPGRPGDGVLGVRGNSVLLHACNGAGWSTSTS